MSEFYYEPKKSGHIEKCVDVEEYHKILNELNKDTQLSAEQKEFLRILATRFIVFKYEKIADYYANTDSHMQEWLEKERCVIVDNDKAMKNGYFEYLEDYNSLLEEIVNEK